jgi:phage-related protein
MGYFIYNDIKSTDKKVIVESMPSITKPPKRYNEINIDGSNRTDIEDLGYVAYEKPISIGLWESDLDDVYDWLQGGGKLILQCSNT